MELQRVSGSRPYVASWQASGGHAMYVGVYPSRACGEVFLATEKSAEAAGFETAESCAAAILAAGFKLDEDTWVDIKPLSGQLGLF